MAPGPRAPTGAPQPADGIAIHPRTSSRERAGRRSVLDICDLWDVMAGFSIFKDVSRVLRLGRTFYPQQRFDHRPIRQLLQVVSSHRTRFRRPGDGAWYQCDCIPLSRLSWHPLVRCECLGLPRPAVSISAQSHQALLSTSHTFQPFSVLICPKCPHRKCGRSYF